MRYLTLSPLLRLRLENVENIIHILEDNITTGNKVHTLGVYGTPLPVLYFHVYNYADKT